MHKCINRKWLHAITAVLVFPLGGCILICNSCSTPPHKAERIVTVSAEAATDMTLCAATSNGNIKVEGQPAGGCEVTAKITARGNSEQEARDMAEAVVVALVPSQQGLEVDIKKPQSELSKHIGISLDIKMPEQNRLNLKTSNGNIDISNISRDVELHTSNGNIDLNRVSGPISAATSNGNVSCHDTANNLKARTSNGNISVVFTERTENPDQVELETSNGSIHLTPPAAFSAKVDASTSNGKISSNRAILVQGDISKTKLHGTIGDGRGTCRLHTSNGSIHIN